MQVLADDWPEGCQAPAVEDPGGTGGADGFTVTLQNAGLNAVGASAGFLGYGGIAQSVAVAFNIWNGRPVGYAVFTGGSVSFNYTPLGNGVSLTSGQPIDFTIAAVNGATTLTMTQGANVFTTPLSVNLAAAVGGSAAYLGFTGGTGGLGTNQRVSNFSLTSAPADTTVTFAPPLAGQTVTQNRGWTAGGDTALVFSRPVAIDGGNGAPVTLTLDRADGVARRIAYNSPGNTLTLRNLVLTGGDLRGSGGFGGALLNDGTATATGVRFANNAAGQGGAIQSTGTLALIDCTFTNNASNFNGGALRLFGTTTIDRSTFNANTVVNEGGALINFSNLTVTNSTFADNGTNAVLLWDGTADLRHVTVAYNRNGGLRSINTSTTLRNSIVAGNSGFDLDGPLTAASSNNLVNLSAAAARIGTLADNGGPTQTILPLPGSPAINGGVAISGVTADQRGVSRPQGLGVDIGAVERTATNASLSSSAFEFETREAVVFNFTTDASPAFGRSSFTLTNLTTGQAVPAVPGDLIWNDAGTQAVLALTNRLADGNYRMVFGQSALDFHVLAGDANRDRQVNFDDLLILARNYNQTGGTYSQGNFDYSGDGLVGFADLLILARNYNRQLSLPRPGSSGRARVGEDVLG